MTAQHSLELLARHAHDEAVELGDTLIWQLRRLSWRTSKAKSSISSSISEGLPVFSVQAAST